MKLISDAVALAMLKAANAAEEFDTGKAERLWLKFSDPDLSVDLDRFTLKDGEPHGTGRAVDIVAHELVKGSKLRRVATGKDYFVKDFERDGEDIFTKVTFTSA